MRRYPADARNPIYSFLLSVTQTGYKRQRRRLSEAQSCRRSNSSTASPSCRTRCDEVDAESLENLPIGLDGAAYQWIDLHGEGISGILTEQAGAWFYKRNLSPINVQTGQRR